jgi:hypothetical protein
VPCLTGSRRSAPNHAMPELAAPKPARMPLTIVLTNQQTPSQVEPRQATSDRDPPCHTDAYPARPRNAAHRSLDERTSMSCPASPKLVAPERVEPNQTEPCPAKMLLAAVQANEQTPSHDLPSPTRPGRAIRNPTVSCPTMMPTTKCFFRSPVFTVSLAQLVFRDR